MSLNILIHGSSFSGKKTFINYCEEKELNIIRYKNDMKSNTFDVCLIFIDLSRLNTLEQSLVYCEQIQNKFGNILPIIICGNKYDIKQVNNHHINNIIGNKYKYFDISCNTTYNINNLITFLNSHRL